MTQQARFALFLVLVSLVASCQRQGEPGSEVKVELTIAPDPPRVGKAKVTLRLEDALGKPVEGATLQLEGNMSHAGMKPVFATAKETDAGRYQADMEFTMGGDWFIL